MSKVVSCRAVGVDCDFEARGETEQETLQKCAEHAKSAHGMDEIPRELADKGSFFYSRGAAAKIARSERLVAR